MKALGLCAGPGSSVCHNKDGAGVPARAMEDNYLCKRCHEWYTPRHNEQSLKSQKKTKEEKAGIVISVPHIDDFTSKGTQILKQLGKTTRAQLKRAHVGFDTAAFSKSHKAAYTYEMAAFFIDDDDDDEHVSSSLSF